MKISLYLSINVTKFCSIVSQTGLKQSVSVFDSIQSLYGSGVEKLFLSLFVCDIIDPECLPEDRHFSMLAATLKQLDRSSKEGSELPMIFGAVLMTL